MSNKMSICAEFDAAQSTNNLVPIASIHAFATQTVPEGYLVCDGSEVCRGCYADLFEAIGTSWGAGDGASTFNLPDLRGEFLRGFDAGRGVDEGREFASWQKPSIAGFDTGNDAIWVATTALSSGELAESLGYDDYDTANYPDGGIRGVTAASNSNLPGGGGILGYSGAVRPSNVTVTYAIKASHPSSC